MARIARFRAAQVARNRKITRWAETLLAELKHRQDGEIERAFVVGPPHHVRRALDRLND